MLDVTCTAHVLCFSVLTLLLYFSRNGAVPFLQFSYLSTVEAGLIIGNKQFSELVDFRLSY